MAMSWVNPKSGVQVNPRAPGKKKALQGVTAASSGTHTLVGRAGV